MKDIRLLELYDRLLKNEDIDIKKYAEEKISRVEKFNDSILKIDATLAASKLKTGNAHVTEILAYLSGSTLKATATETDLYASMSVKHF